MRSGLPGLGASVSDVPEAEAAAPSPGRLARPRLPAASFARVLPTAGLVGACWAMAWTERGSIASGDWLGYGVLAALLLATILAARAAVRPPREALAGLACLLGLALWTALSISWAAAPSLARDEAYLTLFYVVAFAIPLLTLRTPVDRLLATAVLVVGMSSLAAATAVQMLVDDHPEALYDSGRLYFPITYANAQAGIFLVAFWPAVTLAARRRTHVVLRAIAVGAAVALLAGWLLAQSKGGIIGLIVSTIVFFAICPARMRVLVPTLATAGIVAAGSVPLTEPFRADEGAELRDAIHGAGSTLLVLAAVGLAVGLVYAFVDSRITVSERARRLSERAALAALVAGLVAGVAGFFVAVDHPGGFFERQWRSFKHLPGKETTSTHLLTLGSNRYDFWRVSLNEFRDHPLGGVGARGFGLSYLQKRNSAETPARAHSLVFEILMEQGLVGFVLLGGGVGLPLLVAARRASRRRVPAAAAFAGGVYWLTHASVDWIWTFPAVGIPFFCLLGIGASPDDDERVRRHARRAGAVAAAVVALVLFAPVWISARLVDRVREDSATPARDIRWAERLDPLSIDPLLLRAALAPTASARIPPLERAVEKEPRSAGLQYVLGLAYLEAGRRDDARRALAIAHRLDPRDELIAADLARAGGPPG